MQLVRGDLAGFVRQRIAPVASEMISAARPSSSAPTAVAMSQLLVMYPTIVMVSTNDSR